MNQSRLHFFAGSRALEKIRDNGLQPDDIMTMTGAAGGPKWLILGGLDQALFSSWFKMRRKPLFLVGSSSGAWRFAMVAQDDPIEAVNRFADAYTNQFYTDNPTREDIHFEAWRILKTAIPPKTAERILKHPFLRIAIVAVRCNGLAAKETKLIQMAGMLVAMAVNTIHRRGLGLFFKRFIFHDSRNRPPIRQTGAFPPHWVPLTSASLPQALLASGSIPLMMPGVTTIEGAPAGIYRDGGVIDYHMNLPWKVNGGIVLFTHYTDRIIPGWLDKKFSWRHPTEAESADVLMVAPTRQFLASLPYGKIPDRNDFYQLKGNDRLRVAYWQEAFEAGKLLADDFMEAVLSGKIKSRVQPFPWKNSLGW